jgi:hypothetical protein
MSLNTLPVVGKIIKETDNLIREKGVQPAFRELIKRSGTKLLINNKNEETIKILKEYPVIIVANHPAEADVLALLGSLEKRNNFHLIINSSFLNICPNLDKFLIPVGITNRLMSKPGLKIRLRIFKKIHNLPTVSSEEEHEKNIKSIALATERLNHGSAIVIFPGGGGEGGKWFSGVGHMINGVTTKEKTFIIKAYIEGTSDFDYLRVIPGMAKILPPFKITFDIPTRLDQLECNNPKATALKLEEEYNSWIRSLQWERNNQKFLLFRTLMSVRNLIFRLEK